MISCPKFSTLCDTNLPIFFSDEQIRIRDFIRSNGIDGIKISGIDKYPNYLSSSISRSEAWLLEKPLFGHKKNPEHRWKLRSRSSQLTNVIGAWRHLTANGGATHRSDKKNSSKRSTVLQISPVDAEEKYKLLGRVQLGEHRAPLAAWRGSTVASRRSARGARCALGLGPGLLHG